MKGKLRKETHPFVTTYTSPSTPNANTTTSSSSSGIGMTNSVGVNNTVGSGNSHNPNFSTNPFMIPSEIIIFMVGGVTYEEGTKISEFNAQNQGRVQIILGGSTVHNS